MISTKAKLFKYLGLSFTLGLRGIDVTLGITSFSLSTLGRHMPKRGELHVL